jgi:long-chain fatty acid transport protein
MMARVVSMILIPALALVALPGAARASGFQLTEQNGSGLANAFAGSAAVAENASTIFYNPAGMTQLKAREVSGGLAAIRTSFKFADAGSSVGALTGTGNGGDGGGWGFVPNGYLSWALNQDLYIGIGVGAPFGLKTDYDKPWVGAAQSTSFEVKTYNVNPSIAYRFNDNVSLGFGVNWQRLETTYQRQLATLSPALAASPLELTLSDAIWGWNIGALFTPVPGTKVGVSYRSAMHHHTDGKIEVSGPSSLINASASSDAQADLNIPDFFVISVAHALNDRWELLGDLSRTGWSSSPQVDIYRASDTGLGSGNGTIAQILKTDFRSTWRVALGGNYRYDPAWKLKFGIAYDQTPVTDESTRLTAMPDNNRIWFSLGAQWAPAKDSALDVGLAYLYLKDANIDNDQRADGRGRVTGVYRSSAWILGAQYSLAF